MTHTCEADCPQMHPALVAELEVIAAIDRLGYAQGMETAKPPKREAGSARKGDSPVDMGNPISDAP